MECGAFMRQLEHYQVLEKFMTESCGLPESLPSGIILPSQASQHSQSHLHICIPSLLREHRAPSGWESRHDPDAIPQHKASCLMYCMAQWKHSTL